MENGEHVGSRIYQREIVTSRRKPDPNRRIKSYVGVDEKVAALLAAAEERRPHERQKTRLPMGSWSRYYLRCVGCLRNDRHHAADGFCYACYLSVKAYRRRQETASSVP